MDTNKLRPLESEPKEQELEAMEIDEEVEFVRKTDAPEDVKTEVLERLERLEEDELERAGDDRPLQR